MVALQPIFKAAVLYEGGLYHRQAIPENDNFHFLPRVKVPVLMLNGKYDYTFPLDTSQRPFFKWLGTPEKDKKHIVYDSAHDVMLYRPAVIREVLTWLDRYLGPVQPAS
jgi:alpha-beta hydrolase superfamily lysophospholipase